MGRQQRDSFDFTAAMERLIGHVRDNCPDFAHLDPDRMIVACIRTRTPGTHGVYASVQPLRFKDGARTIKKRGRTWTMPEVQFRGKEMMYIVYFAVPRFVNLGFEEKLTTVFHELYHVSPEFNGDLRRFPGKNYAHGHSRKAYNERLQPLIRQYLACPGADETTAFLRLGFRELEERHGAVSGTTVRHPPKPTLG